SCSGRTPLWVVLFSDSESETVTPARHVLDTTFAVQLRVECPADGRNLDRKIAFFDDHARPHRIHDLVLGDQLARPFKEKKQQVCWAHSQWDRRRRPVLANAQQLARRYLEFERLEDEGPRRQRHLMALQTSRCANATDAEDYQRSTT